MKNSQTNIQTVLVTGGCGYLGAQFIRDLGRDDCFSGNKIRILDNMHEKNYQALMDLPEQGNYDFVEGDILDPAAVTYALQDVDMVLHLAAVVQTPMSFENPTWVEQVNHWGTSRLVESCLEAGVKRFVYVSTSAVYGPGGPFSESDVCQPFGAYAQSKFRAEKRVLSAEERGLEPIILRFGTIFGQAPSVRFDAVANRFAYLAGTNRSLTVFGKGEQVRPFIHVRDASEVLIFCLAGFSDLKGEIINAIGRNASIHDLVEAVKTTFPEVRVHYTEQDVLTHLSINVLGEKLAGLGWNPRFTVEEGLKELILSFQGIRT